jgi:hypothetical protein
VMNLMQNRGRHKKETYKILFCAKIDGNYITREESKRIERSYNFTQW